MTGPITLGILVYFGVVWFIVRCFRLADSELADLEMPASLCTDPRIERSCDGERE